VGLPARARDLSIGDRLVELPISFDLASITAYERVIPRYGDLHTSQEAAARAGLAQPIASGTMLVAYAVEQALPGPLGDDWARGGSLGLTFTRPLVAGDDVTLTADVVAKLPRAGRTQIVLALNAQHTDGTAVALGSASATID
jgi:acyl dehydratase